MNIAIWIIAIVEVIRAIQNIVQIMQINKANTKDYKLQEEAFAEYVKSLKRSDKEFVEDMLRKIKEDDDGK